MLADAVRCVAEDLAREVCLCARYYTVTFRGHRVTRVIVSGGGAYEPVLCALLQAQLGADLERARPWRGLANAPDMPDDPGCGCEWAVAFGVALKGWPTGRSRAASDRSGPALVSVQRPPAGVNL